MANEIKVGDVVELKSGGPAMTVSNIDGAFANVTYYDNNTHTLYRDILVNLVTLQPYQDRSWAVA